ncbi:helix-turn-helix transcriptional regulator [Endozoicomonas montiporae]|uniref:helix-turn-helix transcriptional regulator n=1 Tax=Endozoicomonas montiporae TaxID=1027273 RepID=UPI000ACEF10D
MSKTTASRWLNGEQEPKSLQELVNIAKKLGVTTDDLLGLSNEFPAKMNAVMKQLPEDVQEAEFERVLKLLEEYQKT